MKGAQDQVRSGSPEQEKRECGSVRRFRRRCVGEDHRGVFESALSGVLFVDETCTFTPEGRLPTSAVTRFSRAVVSENWMS